MRAAAGSQQWLQVAVAVAAVTASLTLLAAHLHVITRVTHSPLSPVFPLTPNDMRYFRL